jgi:hypothetical protein
MGVETQQKLMIQPEKREHEICNLQRRLDFARNWGLNQQELWVPAKTGAPSLEVGL